MIFESLTLDPFVYLTMLLTQESVNTITEVLTSTSFYGFNAHISEMCSCYQDDSQPCEVIREGISFDCSAMEFTVSDASVIVEMFIDNEHGDAEIFLVCIVGNNGVKVEFEILMKEGSSSSIRLWNVRQYLESL
jgi:hypothetical protein